jgi:hypothetical protein
MLAALYDPDLVAIGGLGAAFATIVLAMFAGFQVKASMDRVTTMKRSAQDQIDALKETTADELALVHKQIEASTAENEAVREAARAQMQPIVFAARVRTTAQRSHRARRAAGADPPPPLPEKRGRRPRPGRRARRFDWRGREHGRRRRRAVSNPLRRGDGAAWLPR